MIYFLINCFLSIVCKTRSFWGDSFVLSFWLNWPNIRRGFSPEFHEISKWKCVGVFKMETKNTVIYRFKCFLILMEKKGIRNWFVWTLCKNRERKRWDSGAINVRATKTQKKSALQSTTSSTCLFLPWVSKYGHMATILLCSVLVAWVAISLL